MPSGIRLTQKRTISKIDRQATRQLGVRSQPDYSADMVRSLKLILFMAKMNYHRNGMLQNVEQIIDLDELNVEFRYGVPPAAPFGLK